MAFSFSPEMLAKIGNVGGALRGGSQDQIPQAGTPQPGMATSSQQGDLPAALAQIIAHLTQQTDQAAQPQPMSPNGVVQPDFSNNPILGGRRPGFGFGGGY